MFIDEAGVLWLSNPWIVVGLLGVAVGLVFWCHRWLEIGRAPLPRRNLSHIRDGALRSRRLHQRQAIRPAVVTVARVPAGESGIRVAGRRPSPRSAA
jgi:hypothetical protein